MLVRINYFKTLNLSFLKFNNEIKANDDTNIVTV